MKIGWLIVGGVAAWVVYKSYQVAQAVKTFQYFIKSVRYNVSNSNLLHIEFDVTIVVTNITQQPISFTSFFGTLYIKNAPVANFNIGNNNGVIINPGDNELTFPISVSVLNLAADIQQLIDVWKSDNSDALISVKGNLTAAGLTVPVNQTLLLNQDAVINGPGELMYEDEVPSFFANANY